jgi:hypothetical protein
MRPGPANGSDPGWGAVVDRILRRPGPRGRDGLTVHRLVFLAQLTAGLALLYVLTVVVERVGRPTPERAVLMAALGVYAVGVALLMRRRTLDPSSAAALADAYRANFFLAFALIEAALLTSFVFVFVLDALWPYLVCLPFWLIAMLLIAPGRRDLARRQQELTASGSPLSITESLMGNPPTPGSGDRR